ncbi:hypothetical protein ACSMFR_05710 [Listeria aquatica]|uniref:hypothetical protein n=1 Tax=Listeria aquatica TaxID=1494960 RepID=UPI003F723303
MLLLWTLLLTVITYYFALVLITKIKFGQRKLKTSLFLSLIIPGYVFIVHFRLAYKHRYNKKNAKVILQNAFVNYDVAVVILAEIMLFYAEQGIASSASEPIKRQNINNLNKKDTKSYNRAITNELVVI